MILPEGFIEMMRDLLKEEADDFLSAMREEPVVSVRINRRKPGAEFIDSTPVDWCPDGLYLKERPQFIFDPLLHAGAYYVQDASSMIYQTVVEKILQQLEEETGISGITPNVLDLCAAPGGKTTAMINALPDGSKIIANEYVATRANALKENLAKWGYRDVSVTNRDSAWFPAQGNRFDIVAVDAPCSGEGMMRKEPKAIEQWSPELIEKCATLQKEIIRNAVDSLNDGGFLIYSTCTFNRKENEENAEFIRDELGLLPFDPQFPKEWGIPSGISTDLPVFRFMPHKTKGEGLFLSIFRKPGDWAPSIPKSKKLNIKSTKPAKQETPEIEDILACNFDISKYPTAELTESQALAYLRRESIILSPEIPKGIVIATYKGLPLGAVKNIGNRANNLYPKGWRILKR